MILIYSEALFCTSGLSFVDCLIRKDLIIQIWYILFPTSSSVFTYNYFSAILNVYYVMENGSCAPDLST